MLARRRERRLAGAGKAEKDGGGAIIADVDGTVHRQDAALGQKIIEDTENRLHDRARRVRAGDQDEALRAAKKDVGFRPACLEAGAAGPVRLSSAQSSHFSRSERIRGKIVSSSISEKRGPEWRYRITPA